ncbi:Tn3 family transposase [Streptomyces yunnanensis]|uniref:Tn3 transposase DDE domain-containing protein n=1 Tax=Streptomyces yunnanensis TaxID=156453 RepID=A0A9X8QVG3_9ACTN|nr:Tn3 family transposase [Streptomyces yunnanensis]SHM43677.1 Tn3 transposase DDE domain-containing protein [Streptomyces yunnanensis]
MRELQVEGRPVDPLDLAQVSPYLTEHIKRFGEYSTHELGIIPDGYDAHLDVDFSMLGDDKKAA